MRKLVLTLGICSLAVAAMMVALPTIDQAAQSLFVAPALAQTPADPPPADPNINVTVTREESTVWYASPVLITVGALVLLTIIVLSVLASRRSPQTSTTIVER